MTRQEVEAKAQKVNDFSLDYHLSHACFACNKLLGTEINAAIDDERKKLHKELAVCTARKDAKGRAGVMESLAKLGIEQKLHIFIDHVQMTPGMGSGRSARVGNQLVVSIPIFVVEKSRNFDGSYNADGVKMLRWIIAHELGHIVLHTTMLLDNRNTQGSLNIRDPQMEQEANQFARKLLDLRHGRNEEMHRSGAYMYE